MRRASGWSPAVTSSPLINTRLRMPRAAAPSRSACRARRLRSRTVSCMIGSRPFSTRRWAAASDDMCTCAPVLSVQLMASTDPRSTSARRQVACGSALLLEDSSAVTTKRPSRNRLASRLGLGIGLPPLGRDVVATINEVDPRRRALQLPIDRLLYVLDVIAPERKSPRAFPGLHPHAAKASRVQDALAAHAAIPNRFLQRLLYGQNEALDNAHGPTPFSVFCR